MSKIVFSGLESSGKSLKLAILAEEILFRNAKWLQQSGIMRPIAFNFPLSQKYLDKASELGIELIFWENLDDLIALRDCDVFIDEIGTYFDSRLWTDLSLDVRRWIQQGAKMGIEMYCACQDFAQVDLSFRRLVSELYQITKVIGSRRPANTKPPVKRIWGVCLMQELNPRSYDENKKEFVGAGILSLKFFTITRHACEMFDTKHFIKKSKPMKYKHEERFCMDLDCDFSKVNHR